ncbi:POZ domain-containing protein [Coccomyxa subellipsoidea C-169]|uniref:POZ domain-containing protein n=1 Tax=Coccomyxa subellipsoidea (strain C-169) TaxID=574566 RepID=I0YZL7_COCSC|nr:POZ domain-containing protein [Coccomyxa subellipsoidea C-169]EIE23836.1 POZ domain-containing protein [Coccomyxa subellipsoidea C-169]|eukprot:XP_005648380.1 POZ domain-containing protein [Coccomyxa subellipsoidea C-169]
MEGNLDASVNDFNEGLVTFKSNLDSVLANIIEERETLRQEREQLERTRQEFEEEQFRVAQLTANASEQVTLNVGGSKYTTTATTLRNAPAPSLFNAMFSGRHVLTPDENGCYFVDRDGRHFHDILNFLRDGTFSYPEDGADFKYLLELRAEAEYYCLSSLVEQIDRFPFGLTRVQRAVSLNSEEGWVYEERALSDEVVISVSAPCQLMGLGLCGTVGAFTVDAEVAQVDPHDFSWDERRLGAVSQSFSKADSHRLLLPKPIALHPGAFYMISAIIKGSQSSCCEECLSTVVASGVCVTFHPWESPNGTTESRGQFPELYIRVLHPQS